MGLLVGAVAGMIGSASAWAAGWIPGWGCFLLNAFLASILHELEHDLIHHLYFKGRARVQDLMLAVIWLFKGNTVSPWYRRQLHLLHHRESGQSVDIEERLIGNGMPWGWRRVAIMLDTTTVLFLRIRELAREIPQFRLGEFYRAIVPVAVGYAAVWVGFLGLGMARVLGLHPAVPAEAEAVVRFLMVALVGPNMLRQACIAVVSSNCHYYGDVERCNLVQQGQALRHWLFFPLQLFCCNFGSTHIIHHFYVNQPFFRRQLFAARAHEILRGAGVRFDDLASLARGNRYHGPSPG
jgi:fatty acid desaturase